MKHLANAISQSSKSKEPKPLLGPSEMRVHKGNTSVPNLKDFEKTLDGGETKSRSQFKIKNYRFVKKLGSGTYATVMDAMWLPRNQRVAVKIMQLDAIETQSVRLWQELEILSKIDHPNLLNLLDWGVHEGRLFIVTEIALGGELFDRILELASLHEADVAAVATTVLKALVYLHDKGIVHRDLKPENIFLRDAKHRDFADLLIGDFGLSKFLLDKNDKLKTRAGSYGYAAPEVLKWEPYGAQCDMWSVGVICAVLLTGVNPFSVHSFDEELDDVIKRPVTFHEPHWRGISPLAKAFVKSLLERQPDKRPTAKEALQHQWIQEYIKDSASSPNIADIISKKLDIKQVPFDKPPVKQSTTFTSLLPIPDVQKIQQSRSERLQKAALQEHIENSHRIKAEMEEDLETAKLASDLISSGLDDF